MADLTHSYFIWLSQLTFSDVGSLIFLVVFFSGLFFQVWKYF